eukprot:gene27619-34082_t
MSRLATPLLTRLATPRGILEMDVAAMAGAEAAVSSSRLQNASGLIQELMRTTRDRNFNQVTDKIGDRDAWEGLEAPDQQPSKRGRGPSRGEGQPHQPDAVDLNQEPAGAAAEGGEEDPAAAASDEPS